jgi:hypothetical protein
MQTGHKKYSQALQERHSSHTNSYKYDTINCVLLILAVFKIVSYGFWHCIRTVLWRKTEVSEKQPACIFKTVHAGSLLLRCCYSPIKLHGITAQKTILIMEMLQNYMSEIYWPSIHCWSVKFVPTFADRGYPFISAMDPHGHILGFLEGWVDHVPDSLLLRKIQ